MGALIINSSGLGTTPGTMAQAQACTMEGYASYIFQPACWGASYDDWQAEFYGGSTLDVTSPLAPAAPSTALTDPDSVLDDTAGTTAQDLSNAALAATQAANVAANPDSADPCQTLSENWPYPLAGLDCPTMVLWGAGIAITLFLLPTIVRAFK